MLPNNYSKTRLYSIYSTMKKRCYNKKSPLYPNYGGRGISVCESWLSSFESFWDWSYANNYSDLLTIDRKNNDLGYSPDNCRWATKKEQQRNKRLIQTNNTSGYKGVYFNKALSKYRASIYISGKSVHLGYFSEAKDGARAYNNYVTSQGLEHKLNIIEGDK